MKTLVLVFLIVCCLVLTVSAQTAEQKTAQPSPKQLSPNLQEAVKLNGEVISFFNQKRFAEALPLAQKIIELRQTELGKNHLSLAQAYWNLGHIQSKLDKRKEAEDSFENAFEVYEKNHPLSPADEKNYVQLLELVAFNQAVKGEFEKAERKFQQAVELREKLNGKDAVETANSLTRLAEIYQVKDSYEKAAPLLIRALDIKTKKSGIKSDETAIVFQDVSCALTKLGRTDELREIENKYGLEQPRTTPQPLIKAGVVNGKALKLAQPVYPVEAKQKRVSGTVEVKVMINEEGKVIRACAVTGAKEIQRTSEIAAYASKFTPTTIQGKPVMVTGIIVYKFVMQ